MFAFSSNQPLMTVAPEAGRKKKMVASIPVFAL
jgi:hypothetical protein